MNVVNSIDEYSDQIDEIVDLMSPELRLFVVTGAGMSAESGLPTYRGVGGLYNRGETEQGMTIEQLLSGSTFRQKPELTWKYLGEIGRASVGAKFNRGHQILAELEPHVASLCILTQNIDGFHVDAGSKDVIEIHGNLHYLRCESCDDVRFVQVYDEISIPPHCGRCDNVVRPHVVLFDEMLLPDACDHLARQWNSGFDMVWSIGTTSVFPYIREPVLHCADHGKPVVEINPTETEVSSDCSFRLPLAASVALQEIWQRYRCKLGIENDHA